MVPPAAISMSCQGAERWSGGCGAPIVVGKLDRTGSHLAIAQLLHNLQDFGPGWERPAIQTFVGVDRHDELELLIGHLAFLGGLAIVRKTASRTAAALQTCRRTDVQHTSI